MVDQRKASRLAKQGFELRQADRLGEVVEKCREAPENVDFDHYALPGYHGNLGSVLAELGRKNETRDQFELAL